VLKNQTDIRLTNQTNIDLLTHLLSTSRDEQPVWQSWEHTSDASEWEDFLNEGMLEEIDTQETLLSKSTEA
jgi:hypothetical protein